MAPCFHTAVSSLFGNLAVNFVSVLSSKIGTQFFREMAKIKCGQICALEKWVLSTQSY